MKVAHGQSISPARSLHDLYTGTFTLNENNPNALRISPGTMTYKSSILDAWDQYSIDAVRLTLYSSPLSDDGNSLNNFLLLHGVLC